MTKSPRYRDSWTPERRAEQADRARTMVARPSHREALTKGQWTPERRAAHAEAMRQRWADPAFRERLTAIARSPEGRERRRQAALDQWSRSTPEERSALMRGVRRAFKGGHTLTKLEAAVLVALNDYGVAYNVHLPIGDYVADIFVPFARLDVECDGNRFHENADREAKRDAAIRAFGFTVVRLSEAEIIAGDFTRLYTALGASL